MKILLCVLINSIVMVLWTFYFVKDGDLVSGWISYSPPVATSVFVVFIFGAIQSLISSLILWAFRWHWPISPIVSNLLSLAIVVIGLALAVIVYSLIFSRSELDRSSNGIQGLFMFVGIAAGFIFIAFTIPTIFSGIFQSILLGFMSETNKV